MKKLQLSWLVMVVGMGIFNIHTFAQRPVEQCPTVYEQLIDLNKYWAYQKVDFDILNQHICFEEHTELIQMHLSLVEQHLRQKNVSDLSIGQQLKRRLGLNILRAYWEKGQFPINNHHPGEVVPYFIDDFGTACAVGHIVRETGFEAFAEKVQQENNYAYIEDMDYPELTAWATTYGFDELELRWIQPGYSAPSVYFEATYVQPTCGQNNGSILMDVNLDLGSFNIDSLEVAIFRWYTGGSPQGYPIAFSESLYNVPAGEYTLLVEDATGVGANLLPAYKTFRLGNIDRPQVQAAIAQETCEAAENGSITLNISGGASPYSLAFYQILEPIFFLSPDGDYNRAETYLGDANSYNNLTGWPYNNPNYRTKVTDADGCIAYKEIALPTNTVGISYQNSLTLPNCNQNNGSIGITSFPDEPLTYLWEDGSTMMPRNNVGAGQYAVTATDNLGCQTSADIYVPHIDGPTLDFSNVSVQYPSCTGVSDAAIEIEFVDGTPPYQIQYYRAIAPTVYPYEWELLGSPSTASSSYTISGLEGDFIFVDGFLGITGAVYLLTVKDAQNCQSTAHQLQIIDPNPAQSYQTNVSGATQCNPPNGSIELSDFTCRNENCLSFSWSDGATGSSRNELLPGGYHVTIYDNCSQDTVNVQYFTVWGGSSVGIVETTPASCGLSDGTATVESFSNENSFSWSHNPSLNNNVATGLDDGDYQVSVTPPNGCTRVIDFEIVNLPDVHINRLSSMITAPDQGSANGAISVTASTGSGELTYNWAHDNNLDAPEATGLAAGHYSLTATSEGGCIDTITFQLNASLNSCALSPSFEAAFIPNIYDYDSSSGLFSSAGKYFRFTNTSLPPYDSTLWLIDNQVYQSGEQAIVHFDAQYQPYEEEVCMWLYDSSTGCDTTVCQTILVPCTNYAAFSANEVNGEVTVSFSCDCSASSIDIDYGNGYSESVPFWGNILETTYTYPNDGDYDLCITVNSSDIYDCTEELCDSIIVDNVDNGYSLEATPFVVQLGEDVVILYNAMTLSGNAEIQFGDGEAIAITNTTGIVNHSYSIPGRYTISLYVNGVREASTLVLVQSCGWYSFVSSNNSYMEPHEDICNVVVGDGRAYIAPDLAEITYYWTNYSNIRPFNQNGDEAILEARIKVSPQEGGISCYDPSISIFGDEGRAGVKFMQTGCQYYSSIFAGQTTNNRTNTNLADLITLTADFDNWVILKFRLSNGIMEAYYNDQLRYTLPYEGNIGDIFGLEFRAKGSGSIDWIRLYNSNEELVYEENFDDCNTINEDEACTASPWPTPNCTAGINVHFINVIWNDFSSDIDGATLAPGDWIGLFYQDENNQFICSDAVQVSDPPQNFLLQACGDDPLTPEKDGFVAGEVFRYKVLKDGQEYQPADLYPEYYELGYFSPSLPNALSTFEGNLRTSVLKELNTQIWPPVPPDCDSATPLNCGDAYTNHTNSAGLRNAEWYNCTDNVLNGPEVVYEFTNTAQQDVKITMSNLADDLELYLFDECDQYNCIAKSERSGTSDEVILVQALPAGIYYVVVEGYYGYESTYDIALECGDFPQGGFSCAPQPISCGANVSATTVGACSEVSFYNCSEAYSSGSEVVYSFSVASQSQITATLNIIDDVDLDLFLLDALDPNACIAYSNQGGANVEQLLMDVSPGRIYYLVVDGFNGQQGAFELRLSCSAYVPCTNPPCTTVPFDCGELPAIACNETIEGNNATGSSNVDTWGQCSGVVTGREVIYTFTNPVDQYIRIELWDFDENLNVYVLDGCPSGGCIMAGDKDGLIPEAIQKPVLPAGEYIIAVDGFAGAQSSYKLKVSCENSFVPCLEIPILEGENYISSNRVPLNLSMKEIMRGTEQFADLLINEEGLDIYNNMPGASPTDYQWDITDGYKLLASEAGVIKICGEAADSTLEIEVRGLDQQGTPFNNYVPYLYQASHLVSEAFTQTNGLSGVFYIAPDGAVSPYFFASGAGTDYLMEGGRGYLLQVDADGAFSYRSYVQPYVPNGCTYFQTPMRQTFHHSAVKMPSQVLEAWLAPGDEIGFFSTDGLLCGSARYDGYDLAGVLQADQYGTAALEGYQEGEPMRAKIWKRSTGRVVEVGLLFEARASVFTKSSIYKLSGLTMATSVSSLDQEAFDWHLYPNPAQERAIVEFSISERQDVTIVVYSVNGQAQSEVSLSGLQAGHHTVQLDVADLPSGAYFVRLLTSTETDVKKLVIENR